MAKFIFKKQMSVYTAETRDDLMTSREALATPPAGQNPRLETSALSNSTSH